ncbi:quinon protein alcohol dehydrogenase-like superfamily [Zopfochytrium polystomum]|nr:quinon protein alcohol dehydrogenase-like superfamily [Zopfochytrium polystomum]
MIVDPNRSGHPILVDVPAMHAFMTARCLVILLNSLRDNICDLSPNLFLNQVPDIAARVEKSIPRHLRYAAKFWVHHLFETPRENRQLLRFETMSGASSSLFNMVTRLCRDKFLNWLEVLCYLDEMAVALSATWQLKTWFEDVVEAVMEGELQQGSTTEGTAVAAVPYTAPTAKRQLFGSFRMFRHRAATAPAALPALLKPWNRSRTPLSPPPTPPTLASRGQHPREVMIAESREIAHDGYRLLRDFAGALTAQGAGGEWVSPLHLYYSGLPFCPTAGALYRTYHDRIVHGSGVLMALSPSVDSASGAVASLGVRPPAKFHQRMSVPTIGNAPKIWGACEATLEGHAGAVWDVAFSTDELLIATAGDDGTVRIWDAETAEEIRAIKPAHKGPVGCLCWFGTNSLHVVSGGDDGFVKMWEFDSAVMILQSQKHVKRVLGVASSSDGRIYSCDDGGFVYAFDAVKFNNSHHDHTPHHHDPAPTDAIYSASSFQGPTRGARYIRVSRDNNYVITAGKGGDLQVFDRDLQPQRRIAAGHQGYSWCLAITPDSRHVLSVGEDRAVKMWNIATGDVEREFLGHAGSLWTVAIAAGGSRAVSGGEDGVLHVWDVAGTVEPSRSGDSKTVAPLSRLHGHEGYIIKADITTDGRKIVSCGDMGVARLWDTVAKDEPRDQSGTFGRVLTVAVSKGSVSPARPSLIVSAGDEGIVRLWDLETRAALHELVNHRGRVSTVAVTPDGSRVISGGHDGLVCVWTLGELFKEGDDNYVSGAGRAVSTTLLELKGHDAPVRAVAITNDGRFVVSGGHDRHVRVWSAETGRQLNDLPGHTSRVLAVAVAGTIAPGRSLRILSGGADFRVILWDGSTGEMLQTLGTYDVAITSAALASFPSPNGVSGDQDLRAAFGVADGRVFVQDITLDRNSRGDIRQSQELQVADFAVRDVKFVAPPPFIATPSPLCYIATASEDGVVRLWEARPQNREETDAKAREVLSLTPDDSSSGRSVAISDDGITAVSAHADGRLYVWDLEVQTCIEAVDTHEWTVQLDHGVTITLARSGWVHVVRHDGTRGMAVLYVPRRCRKRLWFDRRSERVALGGLPSSEGSMLIEFRGGPCLAAPDK